MRSLTLAMALAMTVLSCGGSPSADRASGTASDLGFLSISLTDVRTGERFALGGFPGKVTFFIAMAVW